MIIKVCGMREGENIRRIEALGIDLMGFIFWEGSKRFVSDLPTYMPTQAKRVGVFVDENIEKVKQVMQTYALDFIQLHGHESSDYINILKGELAAIYTPVSVIKAFNIAEASDFEQTISYSGIVDYFLFDTKGKSVGGNGSKFDWSVLESYHGNTPFLLSGGIGPDDAEPIRHFYHPMCIGIDLNSRFETAPGVKDVHQLKLFIQTIKSNEQD